METSTGERGGGTSKRNKTDKEICVITQNSTKGNFGSFSQESSEKSVMPQSCLDWCEGEEAVIFCIFWLLLRVFLQERHLKLWGVCKRLSMGGR